MANIEYPIEIFGSKREAQGYEATINEVVFFSESVFVPGIYIRVDFPDAKPVFFEKDKNHRWIIKAKSDYYPAHLLMQKGDSQIHYEVSGKFFDAFYFFHLWQHMAN